MDIFHLLDQLRIEKVVVNNLSGNAEELEAKIKNLVCTELSERGESEILSLRSPGTVKIQVTRSGLDCDYIREGVNGKKTFSFGHCPNYLNPPP